MTQIRVLIVEDSLVQSEFIAEILRSDPSIFIVGKVRKGADAITEAAKLKPDVITMDVHLEDDIDGLEATKQIMAYSPTRILILSSSAVTRDKEKVFQAMALGALDVMGKDFLFGEKKSAGMQKELIERVKFLSKIRVISHPLAKLELHQKKEKPSLGLEPIVGIVSSTGGPQALVEILKNFPKDFPVPVTIVQHISPGFLDGLASWLHDLTKLNVEVGRDKEKLKKGVVYLAPTDFQMRVTKDFTLSITEEGPVSGQMPSGTVLLESLAQFGESALGVVLTGMGKDGAAGLASMRKMKAKTIAQDEKTSVVYGMPKAAFEIGAAGEVLPLNEIAPRILQWVKEIKA